MENPSYFYFVLWRGVLVVCRHPEGIIEENKVRNRKSYAIKIKSPKGMPKETEIIRPLPYMALRKEKNLILAAKQCKSTGSTEEASQQNISNGCFTGYVCCDNQHCLLRESNQPILHKAQDGPIHTFMATVC